MVEGAVARFEIAQENTDFQYALLDRNRIIVDMNRAFSITLGGVAIGDILDPDIHPVASALCDAIRSGEETTVVCDFTRYDISRSEANNTIIVGKLLTPSHDDLLYHTLFLNASNPMLILDRVHATVYDANSLAALIFNQPREEFIGLHISELLADYSDLLSKEEGNFQTYCLLPEYDMEIGIDYHLTVIDGRSMVLIKMSEGKPHESILQNNCRTIIDATFEGIVVHRDYIIQDCNQTFLEMIGLAKDELIGSNILDFIHEDYRSNVIQRVNARRIDPHQIIIQSKDNVPRRVITRGRRIICDGQPVRMAVFLDITEEANISARLEEEKARLQATIDSLPVGVIITDTLGGFIECNEMASIMWGGKVKAEDFFDYDQFVAYNEKGNRVRPEEWGLTRAILHGETSMGELYDITRFDGSQSTLVISAAPIRGVDGKILGGVEVTHDITRQKELERSLRMTRNKAELYLDILTHDIVNFNTALMSYLDLVYRDLSIGSSSSTYVERCLDTLQASNELIFSIQKVNRSEMENRERSNIKELFDSIISTLPIPPSRQIYVDQEYENDLIVEHSGLLREALANLVSNAVIHTSGEVCIWTRAWREGKRVIISIEDSGEGIKDDLKAHLFKRHVKGSRKGPGQGLGLSLVKSLIENHGGSVRVEDRVPGDSSQGARFVVSLPLADLPNPCDN
ncbi:MAG: PAS domain S-box protein [Euryarchaeota archaeon]|nr:PAS domain S-box protein [Euryarchaeota archaeon]